MTRPRDLIEETDVETPKQAADRLGVSPKTVYSWMYPREGQPAKIMPYATVGRRVLLVCAEVDECADSLRSHRNRRRRHARDQYFAAS